MDGIEYPTFKAACEAMDLLEDDREYIKTFKDASILKKGSAWRSLFVIALLHGSVANPKALWEQFKDIICDDLAWKLFNLEGRPETATQRSKQVWDYGLYLIAQLLQEFHHTIAEFGLDEAVTH